jgi:hypothetical protein
MMDLDDDEYFILKKLEENNYDWIDNFKMDNLSNILRSLDLRGFIIIDYICILEPERIKLGDTILTGIGRHLLGKRDELEKQNAIKVKEVS